MDVYLETDRLVMRRFTESDVDNLVDLDGDPEVMRFLTGRPTPRRAIETEVLPGSWATTGTATTSASGRRSRRRRASSSGGSSSGGPRAAPG
jgi:RimJ/RimL family protein N-acetyltransferase